MTIYSCLTKHVTQHEQLRNGKNQNLRAAFLNNIQWPAKKILKVGFFKGYFMYNNEPVDSEYTVDKAKWVKSTVEKYFLNTGLINLSFVWDVPLETSDIRISFNKNMGAWSELGNNALNVDKNTPTMNLGWLDTTEDYDFTEASGKATVVIHEFGHCLGLIHEHSRSDANLDWNKPYVTKLLGGPPNNWSPSMCDENIFNAYNLDQFNGSEYDSKSIMHYYFENAFFNKPVNLPHNTELSNLDKEYIQLKYPGGGGKSIGEINSEINGNTGKKKSESNWLYNNWYWILFFISFIIFLFSIK